MVRCRVLNIVYAMAMEKSLPIPFMIFLVMKWGKMVYNPVCGVHVYDLSRYFLPYKKLYKKAVGD